MHARIARMDFTGDSRELAARAESGLLPIFRAQPGFKAYSIIASDDEIFSFSAWESAEEAEAANTVAASWVAENMANDVDVKELRFGEILVSTTLGVGTTAGATA